MTQPDRARSDDDLPPAREVEQPEPASSSPSRELLEQVVRRTLADQDGGELPAALERTLHDIACRQRAQSQPWETVVVELVDQVLESWFPAKLLTTESRRKMAAEIADALMHDPVAGARLRRFWERISEVTP
jgi:hypothetical protein